MTQDPNDHPELSVGCCGYNLTVYRVCYVPFIENITDTLFWLTKIPASQGCVQDEEYVLNGTL